VDDGSSAQQFSQGLIVDPDLLNTFSNAIGCGQKTLNFRLTKSSMEMNAATGSPSRYKSIGSFAAAFKEC